LLVFLISYCLCNNIPSISFINVPETINPGELINLEWNYTDTHRYNIEISLCNHIEGSCQKLLETNTKHNKVNTTLEFEESQCYFKEKSIDDWCILGTVIFSKKNQTHFTSKKLKRKLICNGECKEDLCINYLNNNTTVIKPNRNDNISNRINENNDNYMKDKALSNNSLNGNDKKNNQKKEFPYTTILFTVALVTLVLVAVGIVCTIKFKKKEDDPIPIFSVEDSSYCCDMSVHTPVLGNASYHSNTVNNVQSRPLCHSPKVADQSPLSVHLHPINSVSDNNSHNSHNSQNNAKNKGAIDKSNSYKISEELHDILPDHPTSESPYLAELSPISKSSSIPFVSSPKITKKMSVRHDHNVGHHHNLYAESSIILDRKANNSHLISDSPILSDSKSRNSSGHSFNSTNEETKVLSSKHYVLSNFEGDYDKEELNLHYGDIVSVINILPEGWAYGELLLKYNAYTKTSKKPMKQSRYRKFGYYPIRCLSLDEEDNESNSPSKRVLEEEDNKDLNNNDMSSDSDSIKGFHHINKTNQSLIHKATVPLALPSTPYNSNLKSNEESSHVISKNSKRNSILKIFKRNSTDFNIPNKDQLTYFNEPNSNNEKINTHEIINSDNDSDSETIYHDAEEEEMKVNKSSNLDSKRISIKSYISYKNYAI
jgi:hypothetical protein